MSRKKYLKMMDGKYIVQIDKISSVNNGMVNFEGIVIHCYDSNTIKVESGALENCSVEDLKEYRITKKQFKKELKKAFDCIANHE